VLGVALYYIAPAHVLPKSLIGLKEQLIFGILIIVVVVLLPDGLSAAVDRLSYGSWRLLRGRSRAPTAPGGGADHDDGRRWRPENNVSSRWNRSGA